MKAVILALAAASLLAAGSAGAQSGADVVKTKGCMGCHDMEAKKVGPAFKDVAAKYRGNKEAAVKITTALKEGKGHPKASASDAEIKTAVEYVLAAK